MPTVVNNVETLCNIPFIARHGADAYRALSPEDATPGSKLVCFNERFARPGVYEVPFGMTVRELCEDVAGGLRDGRAIKALQIGGPLGGILPARQLDTAFDFDALAAEGCMVGHGGIVAFDDRTDMRDVARHLLHFGAAESCGKCFPCRIGLRRAHAMFADGDAGRPRGGSRSCSRRSSSAACARTAAACRRRSAACSRTSPRSWGSRDRARDRRRARSTVAPGTTVLEAARAAGGEIPTLCFDDRQAPFGACRVCLVGVEGAPAPSPSCTTPVRDGMMVDTPTRPRAASPTAVVELVLSELPEPAGGAHRAGRRSRGMLDVGEPRWPGERPRRRRTTSATPTSPSGTSCASRAGAACARATRCRARSR